MKFTENDITPEAIYYNRREILKGLGFGIAGALVPPELAQGAVTGLPAKRNALYKVPEKNRPLTREELATTYNNFYEFSLKKGEVHKLVKDWNLGPWNVEISGHVKKPKTWDVEKLVKKLGTEERIYRFRCVEAWSMVVPWSGFALKKLVDLAEPTSKAKYIKFTTFGDKKIGPNIGKLKHYPWPYVEGLTLAEATHPLAFMATGLYGKPLPKQNGAPIRLVVPWKYGFKSIKSVVKIEFTSKRPLGLWEELAPKEYGFYANVNPNVEHPRWKQDRETVLNGSFFPTKIPTLMFNGYPEVASLYKNLDLKKNY